MDALAQRLRSERERQGLSVRDLAVVTKIREPYIHAVERGAYDVLPAVYVRSFVRTLGTSLGIPSREINDLMEEVFDIEDEAQDRIPRSKPPEPERPDILASTVNVAGQALSSGAQKASQALIQSVDRLKGLGTPSFFQDRPRAILWAAGALLLVVLVAGGWWLFSGDGNDTALDGPPGNEIDVGGLVDSLMEESADSIMLHAEVLDTAWLTITMDGARTQQLTVYPGTEHDWSAAEYFKLSISNAGGIRFTRDGKLLPLFGQRGQAVREVVITRTDVRSSTTPVQETTTPVQPRQQTQRARRRSSSGRRDIPLITPAPTQSPNVRPSEPR